MTRGALETLFGPLVDFIEIKREPLRERIFESQVKRVARAKELPAEQGIPLESVSLKVLAPWVRGSALDDLEDDEMTERWAALLANAAAGDRRGAPVLPSFPGILAELSPEEASILDALYRGADPANGPSLAGYQLPEFQRNIGMSDDELFDARLFNLHRLSLCEVHYENAEVAEGHWVQRPHMLQSTPLGFRFVAACTAPSAAADASGARAS